MIKDNTVYTFQSKCMLNNQHLLNILFYTFKKFGVKPLYKPRYPSFLIISLRTPIVVLGILSDDKSACNRVLTRANGYEHT